MRYVVIDTETTGFDPEQDRLVEIAAVWGNGEYAQCLINPGDRQIGFGAMATHHITREMVQHAPTFDTADEAVGLDNLNSDTVLVFHNAEFDRAFLPLPLKQQPWVCTYRCALHLVPDAESHSNGALWYELMLDHDMPDDAGQMPHRALFDALMTADLVRWMLDTVAKGKGDLEAMRELYKLSRSPAVLKRCRFGKHANALWADIPSDYMRWALKQDFDDDVIATCRHWLHERGHG